MGLSRNDVGILRCPRADCTQRHLKFDGDLTGGRIDTGVLRCGAGHAYAVRGGIPMLLDQGDPLGVDGLLRPIYDIIAPVHDAGVRFVLPVLQFPDPGASRRNYVEKLELDRLTSGPTDPTPRILEVGIGAGANVPLVDAALPVDQNAEVWGVDLSAGMLDEARRRFEGRLDREVRLALADAHRLPFEDQSFDRVLSVGGVNGFRDPRKALAEMARVAKADAPIVVVDEELDPKREHLALHRLLFRALTAYDKNPHAPVEALPKGAVADPVEPVSRFYYCLRFRMPGRVREMRVADREAPDEVAFEARVPRG